MADKVTGSCLCGTVRFEINGDFDGFFLCHCSRCRKDTGSAHAANLFSAAARLTWISGEDNVRLFDLPGTRHGKAFCAICSSALPRHLSNGTSIIVPAGSLDTPIDMRPNAHICYADRAEWDDELGEVTHIDGLPG